MGRSKPEIIMAKTTSFNSVVNRVKGVLTKWTMILPCKINISKGKTKGELKIDVNALQEDLCKMLNNSLNNSFIKEYQPLSNFHDKIDIYGNIDDINIVIEIDTSRADQVAKKMVSRHAIYKGKPLIYIAIIYPGTKHMNAQEVEKYISYGKHDFEQMGHVEVIGMKIAPFNKSVVYGKPCRLNEYNYIQIP